jgi:hypothetical protein
VDLGFRVLAAAPEPFLEHLEGRRQDEDPDVLEPGRPHLPRTLHVDDERQVIAPREGPPGLGRPGAIQVAEHLGVFQQIAAGNHRFEPLA